MERTQGASTVSGKRRADSENEDTGVDGKAARRRKDKEPDLEVEPHASDQQYNYLTFQRAPPTHLQAGSVVKVSALIANDLRDAVLSPDEPLTLRLAWVMLSADGTLACFGSGKTRATSTWASPSDAYRNIEVLVPQCKAKMEVRLALWVEAKSAAGATDEQGELLRNLTVPVQSTREQRKRVQLPLPVLSAPISISPTTSKESAKSNSITRLIRLPSQLVGTSEEQSSNGTLLQIHESTGHALEKHIWDAALRLIHLMPSYFSSPLPGEAGQQLSALRSAFDPRKSSGKSVERQPLRVVELGAGTALLSIAFAALWAVRARGEEEPLRDLECWATDLEAAVPIMEENITLNAPLFSLANSSVSFKAAALDWNDTDFSSLLPPRPGRALVDLILISDCTYNCDSFEALSRTIARLLHVGSVSQDAKAEEEQSFCLLAKKHRHQGEEVLWRDLAEAGLGFKLLAGMEPVNVDDDEACSGWGVWFITLR